MSAEPLDVKQEKSAGTIEVAVSHESFIYLMLKFLAAAIIGGAWGATGAGTGTVGVLSAVIVCGARTRRIVNKMKMTPIKAAMKRATGEVVVMVETAPLR